MLVEVRPLPNQKWHGKKDKESFAQPKVVEVLYDAETGTYGTGLSDQEAAEYSKKLGVDLTNVFNPAEPHPYWSSKASWITLPNHTIILNTDKPAEFVKWKNMKVSSKVANSMKEWEEGKWPDATHVIFDEEGEVDLKAAKAAIKEEATVLVSKMSVDDKISIVQILSERSVKGKSNNFINVEVAELLETKPAEIVRIAKMGKEEVNTRARILELLSKNILTREMSAVYYMGELIGNDYEEAVKWFKNPNNQKMKVAILEKLEK